MALPDGYDSVVGERGALFSGGERQRIALARALLSEAPVLVLDEATSALDPLTEREVIHAVLRRRRGMTTVMITHRFGGLDAFDTVVVLDGGRVVEWGAHPELLDNRNGLYARMVRAQTVQPQGARRAVSASMSDSGGARRFIRRLSRMRPGCSRWATGTRSTGRLRQSRRQTCRLSPWRPRRRVAAGATAVLRPRGVQDRPVRPAQLRAQPTLRGRPRGVAGNTTWHLVADIERLRLRLGGRALAGVRRLVGVDAGAGLRAAAPGAGERAGRCAVSTWPPRPMRRGRSPAPGGPAVPAGVGGLSRLHPGDGAGRFGRRLPPQVVRPGPGGARPGRAGVGGLGAVGEHAAPCPATASR